MNDDSEALLAMDRLEAELVRFGKIVDWYEDQGKPVPADMRLGLGRIVAMLADMLREPTHSSGEPMLATVER